MKYIDEFRDGALARKLAADIAREVRPDRRYGLMEFCGGHTHAVFRYGIPSLLPPQVRLIHGPGCPVCVLPVGQLDGAIQLARTHNVILCTYGDMLRVPASGGMSLFKARAEGADVRMVYSTDDALQLAVENPGSEVVFFAIGFETTTPPTAAAILQAETLGLSNFSVFSNHVLTPAAIGAIMASGEAKVDGVIGPAHVSTVIGSRPYEPFSAQYHLPVVISGFEPLDVMQSILMLVRQINEGRAEVENEFTRAVSREGNLKAQRMVEQVFGLRPSFEWRGLGTVPESALRIRERYAAYDAEKRFAISCPPVADRKGCECSAIIRGVKGPLDCKLFDTVCTPANPVGSCMVSSEGACAAYYQFGRHLNPPQST